MMRISREKQCETLLKNVEELIVFEVNLVESDNSSQCGKALISCITLRLQMSEGFT